MISQQNNFTFLSLNFKNSEVKSTAFFNPILTAKSSKLKFNTILKEVGFFANCLPFVVIFINPYSSSSRCDSCLCYCCFSFASNNYCFLDVHEILLETSFNSTNLFLSIVFIFIICLFAYLTNGGKVCPKERIKSFRQYLFFR